MLDVTGFFTRSDKQEDDGFSDDNFHGLSPLLGNLSKLRSIWEECRQQFQLNGQMAKLLDSLFSTNFLELEAAPNTSQILDLEASSRSSTNSSNSLIIQMGVCSKADTLKEGILQGKNCGGFDDSYLPGGQFPDWFIFKGEGCSVFFKVPQVFGWCLKAMVLNIVYSSSCVDSTMTSQFLINILIINYTKATVKHHKRESVIPEDNEEWEDMISSIAPADVVEIVLNIGTQHTVRRIIAYLLYDHSKRPKLLN
ncbi:TMV resistance protein N-like [Senna tora]|uniref:TMV resistance protein N-like n=1 Tax=Senna tora TaxID=362788 RepID=A0A834XGM1_9FABA|nr:TMV resistance protein N-like [Senna tora]